MKDSRVRLNILQVHTSDHGGGAELVALQLHETFLNWGHNAYLLVGRKKGYSQNVFEIPQIQRWPGQSRLMHKLENIFGLQYIYAPGSHEILKLLPTKPDIVLIHSLHGAGGYFDLSALPPLCRCQPTFLYLNDMWTLTGHCAYSIDCDRWLIGCGKCPDLARYPAVKRDGTRLNWIRKRMVFRRSNFHLGTAAHWLSDLAQYSPLMNKKSIFTIHNSVDTSIFKPNSKYTARSRLNLPMKNRMILFLANNGSKSPFKDFDCLSTALQILRAKNIDYTFTTVGGEPDQETRSAFPDDVIFRPYVSDRNDVVDYYRAADIFCHVTKADVCPLTVLESQACGTPVVGTRVGGVPEIVKDGETGRLVGLGDPNDLASVLEELCFSPDLIKQMGNAAAKYISMNFNIECQAQKFLDKFYEALNI